MYFIIGKIERLESNVCSFFNSFSASKSFNLFEVSFLFKFFNLSSKSLFFTKLAISLLLGKFTCANPAAKVSGVNLLNSGVVIYIRDHDQ